jgi:CAAX protease family protein
MGIGCMAVPHDETDGPRMAVLVEGGLGILAVLLAWPLAVELRQFFPATAAELSRAALRGAIATIPLLAAFWWLVHADWPTAHRLRDQVDELIQALFPGSSVLPLAFVAILAGVSEELLFRGVLQTFAGRWTTPIVGLLVASVIFGLLHAMSWLYFALATIVGAYLGWLFYYFNDLVGPMTAHALYDFVALLYLTRWSKREKDIRDEQPED